MPHRYTVDYDAVQIYRSADGEGMTFTEAKRELRNDLNAQLRRLRHDLRDLSALRAADVPEDPEGGSTSRAYGIGL